MSDNYLAHSKGPWKKHKYIKKVGNRYYYAGSKGYYKALATTDDANYTDAQKKAAKKVNARNANKANLKRASRKQRVKNVGVSARLTAQKAGRAASNAGKAVAGAAKKAAYYAPYRAKAYGDIAKINVNSAKKKGMAAINKLFGKAKSTAKRVGAQAKNKAYAAPYLAKAYKDKAKFAISDAKKAAKKVKNKAQVKVAKAKGRVKDLKGKQQVRNLNKIRKNVAKAKKKHSSNT